MEQFKTQPGNELSPGYENLKQERPRALPSALAEAFELTASLEQYTEALYERLSPITVFYPEPVIGNCLPMPVEAPLVEDVRNLNTRLAGLVEQLTALIDAVQL